MANGIRVLVSLARILWIAAVTDQVYPNLTAVLPREQRFLAEIS